MSSAADQLPPDVRNKINAQKGAPAGGIGSRAAENSVAARSRAVAMGAPIDEATDEPLEAHPETNPDPVPQACTRCGNPTTEAQNYCARCGADLMRGDFAARLGVKFTDEDIEDYVFRGYVMRDVSVYGKHTVTVKSSQPSEGKDIDDHHMNGAWRKEKDGSPRNVSELMSREQRQLALTATLVVKFDGKSIGDNFQTRLKWLEDHGSAFVDLLSQKAIWFNRALSTHLQKADVLEGF